METSKNKPKTYTVVFMDGAERHRFTAHYCNLEESTDTYVLTDSEGGEVARIPSKNVRFIKTA